MYKVQLWKWMCLTSYIILSPLLTWVLALSRVGWARREAVPCRPWLRIVHAAVPEHNFLDPLTVLEEMLTCRRLEVIRCTRYQGSKPQTLAWILSQYIYSNRIFFFLSWNHRSQMKLSAKHNAKLNVRWMACHWWYSFAIGRYDIQGIGFIC